MVAQVDDTTTSSNFEKLEKLERMVQEKVRGAFTACLAPSNCTSVGDTDGNDSNKMEEGFDAVRAKQTLALRKMEAGIKKHVSTIASIGVKSLMIDDEEDDALLTELASDPCCEDSESGCLNTIGDETLANIENKKDERANKSAGGVKHLPGSYKQSARSKFDYYRKHRAFGGGGALHPISENNEGSASIEANSASKTTSSTSTPHASNTTPLQELRMVQRALAPLKMEEVSEETKLDLTSPASKRNELAKQILKRRQLVQPSPLRIVV